MKTTWKGHSPVDGAYQRNIITTDGRKIYFTRRPFGLRTVHTEQVTDGVVRLPIVRVRVTNYQGRPADPEMFE